MKILIVKLSSLGDVIQTLPVLSPLKQTFPDSYITWLVEEDTAPLLVDHPLIDKVIVFPKNTWRGALTRIGTIPRCLGEMGRFMRQLRADHYDLVIDFQGLLKSGALTGLARAARKRGFSPTKEGSHRFLTERLPYPSSPMHSVDRYLMLVTSLGCTCQSPEFPVPIRQVHRSAVWNFLEEHNIEFDRPLVLLHPGTRWETKMWEENKWAALADMLNAGHDCDTVFTGSQIEASLLDRIAGSMRTRALNSAGMWSLNELAFLQTQADVVVTPDSGPMHLAASVGTPVVALFGPTDPARTGPYGSCHTIITRDMDCRPCFKRQCASKRCMTEITPEEVRDAVIPYLLCSQKPRSMTS